MDIVQKINDYFRIVVVSNIKKYYL